MKTEPLSLWSNLCIYHSYYAGDHKIRDPFTVSMVCHMYDWWKWILSWVANERSNQSRFHGFPYKFVWSAEPCKQKPCDPTRPWYKNHAIRHEIALQYHAPIPTYLSPNTMTHFIVMHVWCQDSRTESAISLMTYSATCALTTRSGIGLVDGWVWWLVCPILALNKIWWHVATVI